MRVLLVSLAIIVSSAAWSQSVGLVKGSRYLDIHYGVSKYSIPKYGAIYYGVAFKEQMALRVGGTFESGNVGGTNFNIIGLGGDYIYNVYNYNGKIYLNGGGGIHGGVELLNSEYDSRKEEQFVFGGKLFGGVNFSLAENMSLGLEFAQWYSHFSKVGNWYYTGTLNYIINLN